MTPAEKIAVIRTGMSHDICVPTGAEIAALLDIAEAAVSRVAYGHDECCELCDLPGCDLPCTCGHDNLAAKLAALGGG